MKFIDSSKDYQRLFQVGMMPYLMSDILAFNYRLLDCLFLFDGSTWISYLPSEVIERTMAEGVELFVSDKTYDGYKREFGRYRRETPAFFERVLAESEILKQDAIKFLEAIADNHRYYIKTEFFYTDRATILAAKNQAVKRSLVDLAVLKNEAREFLNKIFFGTDCYLNRLIDRLCQRFSVPADELTLYSMKDISSLFNGVKVGGDTIAARRSGYVMIGSRGKLTVLIGEKAEREIREFNAIHDHVDSGIIKGTCANVGFARGKVRVIEYGYHNFDEVMKEMSKMEKGEILVAETTSPDLVAACRKAAAIVTNQGGLASHAAVVSRELGIPCVVGTKIATKVLHDGDEVEVDAEKGIVRILSRA